MQDIQRMSQLSPATLEDLLARYRTLFNLETVKNGQEKQVFMDHPSFERLMFIKQLELRQPLTAEELQTQVREAPQPEPVREADIPLENQILVESLALFTSQLGAMEVDLGSLLERYGQAVRDLNASRQENRSLRHEVEVLASRQEALVKKVRELLGNREAVLDPETSPFVN